MLLGVSTIASICSPVRDSSLVVVIVDEERTFDPSVTTTREAVKALFVIAPVMVAVELAVNTPPTVRAPAKELALVEVKLKSQSPEKEMLSDAQALLVATV